MSQNVIHKHLFELCISPLIVSYENSLQVYRYSSSSLFPVVAYYDLV